MKGPKNNKIQNIQEFFVFAIESHIIEKFNENKIRPGSLTI